MHVFFLPSDFQRLGVPSPKYPGQGGGQAVAVGDRVELRGAAKPRQPPEAGLDVVDDEVGVLEGFAEFCQFASLPNFGRCWGTRSRQILTTSGI